MTHGSHSPIEPTHDTKFFVGDTVDIFDKDALDLFPKGPVRGVIRSFHTKSGWYWVRHSTDSYSVPARWDMLKLIKR